jgi:hypothetical protein
MVFDGVAPVGGNTPEILTLWSTGRELNPRILVLQTSALATSPPVLMVCRAGCAAEYRCGYSGCATVRRYGFTVL